jgi:hypothetical protein
MPQFGGQGKPPMGVVFDADLGNTIDAPLALAVLYGLQARSESRVVSVTTSKPALSSAIFGDILVRFYTGEPGGFFVPQPIGMSTAGPAAADTPLVSAVLAKEYSRGIKKLNDTADPVATIRNALSAQFDQNAAVVLAGPAANLAGVLALPGARDLIARKVKLLCVAGWRGGAGAADPASARKLFAEWPSPIVAVPKETGDALAFPAAAMDKELAWTPNHPIVDAWKAAGAKDAPSWAMAAALHAVRPQETYFQLSDPGTIGAADDGRSTFTPSPGGKHRNLLVNPDAKDKAIAAYLELASTKQVPRRGRRGG